VKKTSSEYSDCRCIERIEATEYKGHARIILSPEEAYVMVSRGSNRLWVPAKTGFIPVIPADRDGMRYVRTEPTDSPDDALIRQAKPARK
jgi:hypothetical protein